MNSKIINFEMGPSQTWPILEQFLTISMVEKMPSMNHRGFEPGKFPYEVYKPTIDNVKKFVGLEENDGWELYYGPDATTFMRSSVNLFTKNDRAVVISNGAFGERWYKELVLQGRLAQTTIIEAEKVGSAVNLFALKKDEGVSVVCITQNETSLGVSYHPDAIAILRIVYPNAIVCVDGVSGFPGIPLPYDSVDYILCSGHKLFGIMPGVGFCLMNQRAITRAKEVFENTKRSYGVSLVELHKSYQKYETPCTPNTLGIYCHGMISRDMDTLGLSKLQDRMNERSTWLYNFFNKSENCSIVPEIFHASPTSIVLDVSKCAGGSKSILQHYAEKGLLIAGGYGIYKDDHIRIANYFAVDDSGFTRLQEVSTSIFN